MSTLKALMVLLLVATALPARGDDKAVARQAFREASRRYDIGDFQGALAAFKRAYLAYEDPAFLFNIAQCERMLGDKAGALREYRQYLRKLPNSSHRAEVQRIVSDLQAALDAEKRAQERPPHDTIEPKSAVVAPQPSPAPQVAEAPQAPAVVAVTEQPEKPAPTYKKWWVWTIVGVAAAGVGLGVGLGVALKPSNHTTLPDIGPNSNMAVRF